MDAKKTKKTKAVKITDFMKYKGENDANSKSAGLDSAMKGAQIGTKKYFQNMIEASNYEIAIVDLETTGRDPRKDLIVEVGIARLNLKTGAITKLFDSVVKEKGFSRAHCDSWIFYNSDLQCDKVKKAPLLSTFREKLEQIFSQYPITAYNRDFDLNFLQKRGFSFPKKLPCPMIIGKDILKIPHRKKNDYKFPSFEEIWAYYFPDMGHLQPHRAYGDAEAEAKIVFEMYKKGDWP
ncbi:MAG: 3'-5' exonuclease [Promethearchaeota archaeon]